MIWPPFTILVLKNARRPATIRVTRWGFILLLAAVPVLSCLAGFGVSQMLSGKSGSRVSTPKYPASNGPLSGSDGSSLSGKSAADIGSVFVSRVAGGEMELSFTPADFPPGDVCYAWIIGNPDNSESIFVHPRGPVFHGVPVDYRNGVSFMPVNGRKFAVTADDVPDGILVEGIRVLIYSSAGGTIIDKRITLDNAKGL